MDAVKTPGAIALDILRLSRSTLMVKMRFMDAALCELRLEESEALRFATDMSALWYAPRHVLSRYLQGKDLPTRDFLHITLHGIFQHAYVGMSVDRRRWDLACDIAVEAAISEMPLATIASARAKEQRGIISELQNALGGKALTAERLYSQFMECGWTDDRIIRVREFFFADSHEPWYPENYAYGAGASPQLMPHGTVYGAARPGGSAGANGSGADEESGAGASCRGAGEDSDDARSNIQSGAEKRWQEISSRVQADLESFSKEYGTGSGNLVQSLREANRERYDYATFLRKFAVLGEVMRLSDDEFDYVYYTYGLGLYGNMPLIEPLEYREDYRIKDFVIAIDTSGSTAGGLVQKFLNKTYNILQQSESFHTKVNIHIIQCDADVQSDHKITSRREFEQYMETMQLLGGGGTDFRPVFKHVGKLIRDNEFANLRGMIYFTDGYGAYPTKKPPYETAFVFIREDYIPPEVPPWAMKLVLEDE